MNRSRNIQSRISSNLVVGKNAERERNRVRCLRAAFQTLQGRLPTVPPNTKLSKLDILILATNYINQLTKILEGASIQESALNQHLQNKFFHPIKKWPMRKRLYSRMKNDDDDVESIEADEEILEENSSIIQQTDHLEDQQMIEEFENLDIPKGNYSDQNPVPESGTQETSQEYSQGQFQVNDFLAIPEKYDSHFDLLWIPPLEYTL